MARIYSHRIVAAAQAVQRQCAREFPADQAVIGLVRYKDPENPGRYRPAGSYAKQIQTHAAAIGLGKSLKRHVLTPDSRISPADVVRHLIESGAKSVHVLDPIAPDRAANLDAMAAVKDELRKQPSVDVDDLLGLGRRAPTGRAMIAMANVALHGPNYYVDKTLDELSELRLPPDVTPGSIVFGGEGALTCKPAREMLSYQGIRTSDEQVATAGTQDRLVHLPPNLLLFIATPLPEHVRSECIPGGSVLIDFGCGVVGNETYGNVDRRVADRPDVKWTPPKESGGPVSTSYLLHHHLEAMGIPPHEVPRLGSVALEPFDLQELLAEVPEPVYA